ncbi:hypothetical protein CV014_07325 [Nostoc sp. CMAA1605]|nr:hypothetical protein [Nostoc sp. CMAA1605]
MEVRQKAGEAGGAGGAGEAGEEIQPRAQCPMPNARSPVPDAQSPIQPSVYIVSIDYCFYPRRPRKKV